MRTSKKLSKIKEPIRIRSKQLSNGNRSLYLDKYTDGKREYEFLKLYLIPERTPDDKKINAATIRAANSIKATRILELANEKAGIRAGESNLTLSHWIDTMIERRKGKASPSSIRGLGRIKSHLTRYIPDVKLTDIDKKFCIGFSEYLKTATVLRSAPDKNPKHLAATTQVELFNTFSIILNEAVREERLPMNPIRLLTTKEKFKKPESTREYLTPDEVKKLIATPVAEDSRQDKAAFLFGCFCGLRYSDIAALKWSNITTTCGGILTIRTQMKKTRRPVVIPLPAEAIAFLPAREGAAEDARVFTLPHYAVTRRRLKKWTEAAGIKKKVTFHVSRHTFATMMLTAGADLFVVSKLLGHSDIGVTQIYARIVDKKKVEAVNLLSGLF